MPAFWWVLFFNLGTGVFLGLTKGLALVLEHFDCVPFGELGEIGVKLKFLLRVLGLGGTESSVTGVSKLTRRLALLPSVLNECMGNDWGKMEGLEKDGGSGRGVTGSRGRGRFSEMPFCSNSCRSVEIFEVSSGFGTLGSASGVKYLDSSSSCWLLLFP